MKYEKQFRRDKPETTGETDKHFDLSNYTEWLEEKLQFTLLSIEEFADEVDRIETNVNSFEFKVWSKLNELSEI